MPTTIIPFTPATSLFEPAEKRKSALTNRRTNRSRVSPLNEPETRLWQLCAQASRWEASIELLVLAVLIFITLPIEEANKPWTLIFPDGQSAALADPFKREPKKAVRVPAANASPNSMGRIRVILRPNARSYQYVVERIDSSWSEGGGGEMLESFK